MHVLYNALHGLIKSFFAGGEGNFFRNSKHPSGRCGGVHSKMFFFNYF